MARSALIRARPIRRLTPRIRRELASIARCASSTEPISSAAEPGSAIARVFKQLRKLKTRAMALPGSAADEIGSVLDAHLAMVATSRLIRGVNRRIGRSRINAERAIQLELEEIGETFSAMEDDYLAARIDDIRVVGARLIRNLLKKPYVAYSSLSGGAIILAEEVTPADTALMDPRRIGGFATEYGGREGHTAIMARALGLPAVLGIPGLLDHARAEAPVIVDGTEGAVILDPAPETVRAYKARQQEVARERRLLDVQLAAMLRAAARGPVRIMLPMVSTVSEVRRAREAMEQVSRRLRRRGVRIPDELPPLGAMVEVPAAALAADALAAEADFFAIGTNDLVQYTLAVDRSDETVADLYNPLHPAVLRLIQFAVEAAARRDIPISICGEIAGDPRYAALLLGLGLRQLSMSPRNIPRVKQRIRNLDMVAASRRVRAIMDQSDPEQVAVLLDDFNATVWATIGVG